MAEETYRRVDAAAQQLEKAIELYFEGVDYLSALTLAGAAEGQLGEWLAFDQEPNAHTKLLPIIVRLTEVYTGEQITERTASDDLNEVRNWLKHYREPESLVFDAKERAFGMIDRAIINFRRITGGFTDAMLRFLRAEGYPY